MTQRHQCLFTRPLNWKAIDLQMVDVHVWNIGLGLAQSYIQHLKYSSTARDFAVPWRNASILVSYIFRSVTLIVRYFKRNGTWLHFITKAVITQFVKVEEKSINMRVEGSSSFVNVWLGLAQGFMGHIPNGFMCVRMSSSLAQKLVRLYPLLRCDTRQSRAQPCCM